jgi:outer membrane protein assembly factor BamB
METSMSILRYLLLSTLILGSSAAAADHWGQWRGPLQNGVAPGENFPISWGEEQNILWKVQLPGWGTSTPAIWDDQIFVTTTMDDANGLICLNRAGTEQWRVTLGRASQNRNQKASAANPSPVTDGTNVFVYYKSGDLACIDFDGQIVWQFNLQQEYGEDRLNWDLGTSPVLTQKAVVVAVMHQGPSYVVALDRSTGEVLWRQQRDLGAPAESRDSYTTPLVVERDGREILIILGADHVTAHAADTGQELWRVGNFNPQEFRNYRSISSPVIEGDIILAPYARGESLTAIRTGGKGDVTSSHVLWKARTAADVPSPVVYEGRVYICGDRYEVSALDFNTGELVWQERIPRSNYAFSASPVIAGGHLYCTREDGTTFVFKLGETPELVATNSLRERTYATPAFVDGRIYLRTSDYLFCIGDVDE